MSLSLNLAKSSQSETRRGIYESSYEGPSLGGPKPGPTNHSQCILPVRFLSLLWGEVAGWSVFLHNPHHSQTVTRAMPSCLPSHLSLSVFTLRTGGQRGRGGVEDGWELVGGSRQGLPHCELSTSVSQSETLRSLPAQGGSRVSASGASMKPQLHGAGLDV